MDKLWAPWRMEYILGPKPEECVFCLPSSREEDRERLVLFRGQHNFVIMNKFPYNNGHLMVAPYRHAYCPTELEPFESHEMMDLLQRSAFIIWQAFNPDGINMGLNVGEAAGAGIEEHIHFHLLPRWTGDHSFLAVFGGTMVIPEDLSSAYNKLKPWFEAIHQS